MVNIGIINKTGDLAEAVRVLMANAGMYVGLISDAAALPTVVADVVIYDLSENCYEAEFDILVMNDYVAGREAAVSHLRKDGFLIVNGDNKEIYRYLPNHQVVLITYGFSGKACVTASSVMDSEIQLCIQRRLPTLTGQMLEEQEFSVCHNNAGKNVYDMLSAVTAVMVTGVEIAEIMAVPV